MGDGISDALLVWQSRINFIRDGCIGPTKLLTRDADRAQREVLTLRLFQALRSAKDDVTFKDGQTVHLGVEDRLLGKSRSIDQSGASYGARPLFSVNRSFADVCNPGSLLSPCHVVPPSHYVSSERMRELRSFFYSNIVCRGRSGSSVRKRRI
jgi:hypothetical protein